MGIWYPRKSLFVFAEPGVWPPTAEHVEQLASVSESDYINAETYHSYLAHQAAGTINTWIEGFDAENSGLFDNYSIYKASQNL